jgi:mono/diheme cytochrome c family protein
VLSHPPIDRIDRRVKVWLLIVSVLTLAALGMAAWREEFGTEWRRHQRDYREILQAKATDDRGREILSAYEVRLRQAVIGELGVVDRCLSCHIGIDDPRMTDVANPHRVHPGDYVTIHPPERFGCTICHRGQGAAVTFDEAKSEDHHWDYPLLPTDLTQSSCGLCHTPQEVNDAGGERLARGDALYQVKGCGSCHRLDGRGGNMGPALDNVGLKVRGQLPMAGVKGPLTLPQWLIEHFDNPQGIVAGSQMKTPGLSYEETRDLTAFMLAQQERDLPQSYLSADFYARLSTQGNPSGLSGAELYTRYCGFCHDDGTYGRYDKMYRKFFPAVRNADFLAVADSAFLTASIRDGRPGTLMPAWGRASGGLFDSEIARIVEYLRESSVPTSLSKHTLPVPTLDGGNAASGGRVFRRMCVGCHGAGGIGHVAPALANSAFQRSSDNAFLYRTIAFGRRNTAMPAFLAPGRGGLSDKDIADVIAYLRTLGTGGAAPLATAVQD